MYAAPTSAAARSLVSKSWPVTSRTGSRSARPLTCGCRMLRTGATTTRGGGSSSFPTRRRSTARRRPDRVGARAEPLVRQRLPGGVVGDGVGARAATGRPRSGPRPRGRSRSPAARAGRRRPAASAEVRAAAISGRMAGGAVRSRAGSARERASAIVSATTGSVQKRRTRPARLTGQTVPRGANPAGVDGGPSGVEGALGALEADLDEGLDRVGRALDLDLDVRPGGGAGSC